LCENATATYKTKAMSFERQVWIQMSIRRLKRE